MKNKNHRVLIIIMIVAAVAVALAFGIYYIKGNQNQTVAKKSGAEGDYTLKKNDSSAINYYGKTYTLNSNIKTILFMGIDQTGEATDEGYGKTLTGGRSDSMMLLMVNQTDQTIQVLDISRDTMAEVDVYGTGNTYLSTATMQITMQYAYGEGTTRSCQLTEKAVSRLLYDVPINAYLSLNMDGLQAVVNSLGGLSMTIPDDYTSIDPSFVKGATVQFDGALAEKYVRYRNTSENGSNNGRMVRQDQFVRALAAKLKEQASQSSSNLQKFLDAANPYMVSDLSGDEIKQLASCTLSGDSYHIPGNNIYGNGHDEFWADDAGMKELIVKLLYLEQ